VGLIFSRLSNKTDNEGEAKENAKDVIFMEDMISLDSNKHHRHISDLPEEEQKEEKHTQNDDIFDYKFDKDSDKR
jgi:hypothetical protein